MKKFSKYIFTLAALAFAATACLKEVEYEKGQADLEGCYGLYFPVQDASGSHTFNALDEPKVEFTVARKNSDGAITVPLKYTESHAGIFQLGELTFEDGQSESTLAVAFPDAEIGVTYKLSLAIEDPQYASLYDDVSTHLDFAVLIDYEWIYVLNPQTNKPANFTFYMDYFQMEATGKVKYYELNGVRYCKTETDPVEDGGDVYYGFWAEGTKPGEGELNFVWYPNEKLEDGGVRDAVELPMQFVYNDPNYGACYLCDSYVWNAKEGDEFLAYSKEHNSEANYYTNGTFAFFTESYYFPAAGGGYPSGYYDIILEAEGYAREDYSLYVVPGQSKDGVLPVQFATGVDVASIKYAAFEGSLYASQIAKCVDGILDESIESSTLTAEQLATSNTVDLTFDETGMYTVVAVAYDAAGEFCMSASSSFGYVALDDSVPVIASAGLASADKYVPQGYSTDNALEYWVYGKDLTSVKMGLFREREYALGEEHCINKVKNSLPLDAETLALVNGQGYVSIFDDLKPGREYYLLVLASNGYETKQIWAKNVCTTGEPNPLLEDFNMNDTWNCPESSAGYFGTYNLYAKKPVDGQMSKKRVYCNEVTISDSARENLDADADGNVTEYVEVTGLFPQLEELGSTDKFTFEFYSGVLFNLEQTTSQATLEDKTYYAKLHAYDGSLFYTESDRMLLGGFVEDGYLAFVNAVSPDAGFAVNGLQLVGYTDAEYTTNSLSLGLLTDLLLAGPAKDSGDLESGTEGPEMTGLKLISKALKKGPTNYVESRRGNIRSIIDQVRNTAAFEVYRTSVKGVRDIKSVEFTATSSNQSVQKGAREFKYFKKANIARR